MICAVCGKRPVPVSGQTVRCRICRAVDRKEQALVCKAIWAGVPKDERRA